MNWQTYQQLNEEQRKEYDYKFSKEPGLEIYALIKTGVTFFLVFSLFIMSSYFLLVQSNDEIKSNTIVILETGGKLASVMFSLLVIGIVYNAVKCLVFVVRKKRWLRKNNIKYKYWWATWFK